MGLIYRPNHPYANENGLVERALVDDRYETGAAPAVHSDTMDPTRHMCDNKMYTSKAKFRETTKAHGCIEVGNDPAITRARKPVQLDRGQRREDIRRSIHEIRNGRRPMYE